MFFFFNDLYYILFHVYFYGIKHYFIIEINNKMFKKDKYNINKINESKKHDKYPIYYNGFKDCNNTC